MKSEISDMNNQKGQMMDTREMAMQNKHKAVYRLYEQYRREWLAENPIAASYLPISYYAEVISRRPEICMSAEYVQKIIRKMIRQK